MSNAPTRPRFDKHRDLVLEAKKGTHAARQRWPEGGGANGPNVATWCYRWVSTLPTAGPLSMLCLPAWPIQT